MEGLNLVDVVVVTADCGRITSNEIGYDLYEINLFINVSADKNILTSGLRAFVHLSLF